MKTIKQMPGLIQMLKKLESLPSDCCCDFFDEHPNYPYFCVSIKCNECPFYEKEILKKFIEQLEDKCLK